MRDLLRIDDLHPGIELDVSGGDGTVAVHLDEELVGFALLRNDEDFLEVEHDVRDVLDDAVDGLELVVHAVDLDRADGAALDGAEEHAAEGVADRVAIAGLEGLGDELGVGGRGALLNLGELGGEFEFSETLWHGRRSFRRCVFSYEADSAKGGLEARVVLDDQLLVDGGIHLVADGQAGDDAGEGFIIARDPAGDDAGPVFLQSAGGDLAGVVVGLDLDGVAGEHRVAGNVDLVGVDLHVAVIDELAGLRAALGETHEIDDAVKTGLEELEEALAGDAALALGDGERAAELAFEQTVDEAEFLLLVESDRVFRQLATGLGSVLAGGKLRRSRTLAEPRM